MADKVDTTALLAKVDIVEVIDRYVPLTKSGGEYEACCPFHGEDTPSFKVSPSKQFYHCFGCGAHGDAIGFLMQHQGLSFRNAVEALGGDLPETGAGPARAPAHRRTAVACGATMTCSTPWPTRSTSGTRSSSGAKMA